MPLDIHLFAFEQVIRHVFRFPQDDVVPIGHVLPFAGLLVLRSAVGSEGECGAGNAIRREFSLGILAEMPNQYDFVDASGCHLT